MEYSIDQGSSWSTARRFKSYTTGQLMGSGVANLPSNKNGISYEFWWDYVNDIGFNNEQEVLLRITPKISR